jgi:prepilin-type N-terminal cleavage/methylation domain-containing protein
MRPQGIRCQQGFTLTELLVAMVLAGLVTTAVYSTYNAQQQAYVKQSDACIVQQNLRAAMFHLERAIRMAGFNPKGKPMIVGFTDGTNNTVNSSTDSQVTLTYDNDESGVLEDDEIYKFQLNGNDLDMTQGVATPVTQTIAEGISGLTFTFLDSTGAASTANTTSVLITITGSRGTNASTLTNRVFCRNLVL